jgi:hypothetical protein
MNLFSIIATWFAGLFKPLTQFITTFGGSMTPRPNIYAPDAPASCRLYTIDAPPFVIPSRKTGKGSPRYGPHKPFLPGYIAFVAKPVNTENSSKPNGY